MPKFSPKFCQKVREDIKKWDDYWRSNNVQYHEFMDFVMGNQWKEDESKLFERYNKVPLVMNKLAPLINNLLGQQRQNTPNLQAVPEDNVDERTAEIREALIKEISLNSEAKVAYQHAFQCAAIGGFGTYFIGTKYANEFTFKKDVDIRMVKDPTRCYWDVAAESPCKTDGMVCGMRTRISRKKFRAMYGRDIERRIGSASTEDGYLSFSDDDSITFVDHFEQKIKTVKLYLLSNEREIDQKEYNSLQRETINDTEFLIDKGEIVEVMDTRDAYRYGVKHYQIAGDFILEKEPFPSEQLPLPFVDQLSYFDKDNKQICRPFVKDAKDAQRYINYLATQSAYLLKVSRWDQFMASKANIKSADTMLIWRDPTNVQGALIYDEDPNGNKPEQLRPPELSPALVEQYQRAISDIESCTGMYGTQMGQSGNEISGDAIDARTRRGNFNTYIPFDSLNRAIAVGGQIINEMIPKIYSTKRLMKLTLSDQNVEDVTLNNPLDEYGAQMENDMTQGRFKVRLLPGPSFEGQKAENLQSMKEVLQADKTGTVFPLIADLFVESLPMANSLQMRNRLRVALVPPEIIEAGKTGKPLPPKPQQPDPQQMAAMLEQQNKMKELQQKDVELQQSQQELQMKGQQMQMDFSTQIQELQSRREELAAQLQEQELRYAAELQRTQADLQMTHADHIVKLLMHAGTIHQKNQLAQAKPLQK